jgi:hypothetical protein
LSIQPLNSTDRPDDSGSDPQSSGVYNPHRFGTAERWKLDERALQAGKCFVMLGTPYRRLSFNYYLSFQNNQCHVISLQHGKIMDQNI